MMRKSDTKEAMPIERVTRSNEDLAAETSQVGPQYLRQHKLSGPTCEVYATTHKFQLMPFRK